MKTLKFTLLVFIASLFMITVNAQNQGVAINSDGSQADPSAMLDVKSTTGGILIPRMTQTERNNIASPAQGLMVFQTDNTSGYYYYDGGWKYIGAPDSDWTVSGNDMYSNNSGNVGIGTNTPGAKLDVAGHIWQTGTGNSVFLGENAGTSDDLNNNASVFIGYSAGNSNTSGDDNIAIGSNALVVNSTGNRNIAIGNNSSWLFNGADNNVTIGQSTAANNLDGGFNTIVGTWAFKSFKNSSFNTALGFNALGDYQFFPWLNNEYSGDRLTAVGYESLFKNQEGIRNTGVGYKALHENETGNNNTALGYGASETIDGLNNTTALGSGAIPTADNQVVLGNANVTEVVTAGGLTAGGDIVTTGDIISSAGGLTVSGDISSTTGGVSVSGDITTSGSISTSGGITVGNSATLNAGTIRFDPTDNHFYGYNGTTWVQLDN